MSLRFAAGGKPKQLKFFAGNMLACQNESGFIPSSVHFKNAGIGQTGPWHAQPWLAQSVATYVDKTGDTDWLREIYPNSSATSIFGVERIEGPLPYSDGAGARLRARSPGDSAPALSLLLSRSRYWQQDRHLEAIVVEESGPEKVILRRKGWYQSKAKENFCQYDIRYVIFRNSPLLRVFHT